MLISDYQLKARILDASDALKRKKRRKTALVGSDATQPPGPPPGPGQFLGLTRSGLFRRETIYIRGTMFVGDFGNPCSPAFIDLLSVVYHEARHAAGDMDEQSASAGAIRALQTVRDNMEKTPMFKYCKPPEIQALKNECNNEIAAQAAYAGINVADAPKFDVDKERTRGR